MLLYFDLAEMQVMEVGPYEYYDKIPLKKNLRDQGVRLVPPGTIRYGAHVERGAVVMPGYVNIGAYVGAGTMVDTWATVGSCAQIGSGVHLSGGVGIGGVLEPLQAALGQRWGDHHVDYYSFILAPPLEIALQTRGPRTLSEKDRDWIRQMYEWNLHAPGFGIVIDNQDQTPEQTAALIADYIRNRRTEKPHDS